MNNRFVQTNNDVWLARGECLELMRDIPDSSIDMVLCDLPYGTTACPWDVVIPFEPLWEQYERLIKPQGAIVLFGSQPFTTALIASNYKLFKYEWIWEKSKSVNFHHAKNMPIKHHENVLVFSKAKIGHKSQLQERRMTYFPQDLIEVNRKIKQARHHHTEHNYARPSKTLEFLQQFTNYPQSIIKINNSDIRQRGSHPTQKPVPLCEYLIKTYTLEGETVLDNTMGSGTTGVACVNTNRKFIGIELEEKYFTIAQERIEKAQCILQEEAAVPVQLNLLDMEALHANA